MPGVLGLSFEKALAASATPARAFRQQRGAVAAACFDHIALYLTTSISTVQNFFSKLSKAPSIYTVAPICKVLGISLDEVFGITEHLTPTEETLQARNDELERHVDAKADMIEIMRRGVRIRNGVVVILFIVVALLAAWCLYIGLHCADYGFWRG